MNKTKKMFKDVQFSDFDESLKKTVEWYKENKNLYSDI